MLAKRLQVPLLTDNKAPKRLTSMVEKNQDVMVMDSLDVLKLLFDGEQLKNQVTRFMKETSFRFSRFRLGELGIDV